MFFLVLVFCPIGLFAFRLMLLFAVLRSVSFLYIRRYNVRLCFSSTLPANSFCPSYDSPNTAPPSTESKKKYGAPSRLSAHSPHVVIVPSSFLPIAYVCFSPSPILPGKWYMRSYLHISWVVTLQANAQITIAINTAILFIPISLYIVSLDYYHIPSVFTSP